MKFFTAALFFAVLIVFTPNGTINAQNSNAQPNKFVQFYVVGITTAVESRTIDAAIRIKPGIITSRTDHKSRIFFCIFPANETHDENTFISWLNGLGYQISCYREGIHGLDKIYSREGYICD